MSHSFEYSTTKNYTKTKHLGIVVLRGLNCAAMGADCLSFTLSDFETKVIPKAKDRCMVVAITIERCKKGVSQINFPFIAFSRPHLTFILSAIEPILTH